MSITPTFTLAHRLRIAREHAQLTTDQLAQRLGVSRNTVSRYENGRHEPARGLLVAWSVETGVSFSWILGEEVGPIGAAKLDRRKKAARTAVTSRGGDHSTGRYGPGIYDLAVYRQRERVYSLVAITAGNELCNAA